MPASSWPRAYTELSVRPGYILISVGPTLLVSRRLHFREARRLPVEMPRRSSPRRRRDYDAQPLATPAAFLKHESRFAAEIPGHIPDYLRRISGLIGRGVDSRAALANRSIRLIAPLLSGRPHRQRSPLVSGRFHSGREWPRPLRAARTRFSGLRPPSAPGRQAPASIGSVSLHQRLGSGRGSPRRQGCYWRRPLALAAIAPRAMGRSIQAANMRASVYSRALRGYALSRAFI